MRGESKKNSSKRRSFILSLFFPGWNEMLQFWALGKDVYSTLNKTEVYFKMKHHLKLLRKRPNKKHLHFFQNPFPIFLLLFFFPSIETNVFDQHEFTKHSSQATCIISVGKNSYLPQAFCPVQPPLRRQRETRAQERWAGFPEAEAPAGQCGAHNTPAHGYPPPRPGRRRFRMSLFPLGAGWMLCEHPSLSCLYFYLGQQPLYHSGGKETWCTASSVQPMEQAPFGISCGISDTST